MIIYDGEYNWSGKKDSLSSPISWWPGYYTLKIIDLSNIHQGIRLLKPIVIVAADTGRGISAIHCAQNLVKSVCRDFDLFFEDILWIEHYKNDPEHMEVAMFHPEARIADETLYSVKWRPIMPNELAAIKDFVPAAENILRNIDH